MQALIKGEIDATQIAHGRPVRAGRGRAEHRLGRRRAPRPSTRCRSTSSTIRSSTAHPAVLDPVVREAISWAIDKQTLVDRVLRGYGDAGHHADRAALRLLALGAARRREDRVRPGRGQPAARRGGLRRHRRRRHPGDARAAAIRSSGGCSSRPPTPPRSRPRRSSRGGCETSASSVDQVDDRQQALRPVVRVRLGHDHLLVGHGTRPGLHPVQLHERAVRLLERHLLREPRVRRALRGAADRARRGPSARRSCTRCSRSSTRTPPRSCCGTRTASRRGGPIGGRGSCRWPEPDGVVVLGEPVLGAVRAPVRRNAPAAATPTADCRRRCGSGGGRGRRAAIGGDRRGRAVAASEHYAALRAPRDGWLALPRSQAAAGAVHAVLHPHRQLLPVPGHAERPGPAAHAAARGAALARGAAGADRGPRARPAAARAVRRLPRRHARGSTSATRSSTSGSR